MKPLDVMGHGLFLVLSFLQMGMFLSMQLSGEVYIGKFGNMDISGIVTAVSAAVLTLSVFWFKQRFNETQ